MSYYWTPVCETCEEDGPKIRSGNFVLKFGPDHHVHTDVLISVIKCELRSRGIVLGIVEFREAQPETSKDPTP